MKPVPFLAILPFILAAFSAAAEIITIDPAGYAGSYSVGRDKTKHVGAKQFDLPANVHTISFAPSNGFRFEVKADGSVVSLSPAATGGDRVLTFDPVPVRLEYGTYAGSHKILNIPASSIGLDHAVYHLPRGVPGYFIWIAPGNGFPFDLLADGTVVPGSDAIQPVPGGLRLRSTNVRFRTFDLAVPWRVKNVEQTRIAGDRDVALLPDVKGFIMDLAPGVSVIADIDVAGNVIPRNPGAARSLGSYLDILTVPVSIVPVGHNRRYWIVGGESRGDQAAGPRDVYLVREAGRYSVALAPGKSTFFEVDESGVPAPGRLTVSDDTGDYSFALLAGTPAQTICRFDATLTLRQDVSAALKKGAELALSGHMAIDRAHNYGDPMGFAAHYTWSGALTVTDGLGGVLTATRGNVEITSGFAFTINQHMGGTLGGRTFRGHVPLTLRATDTELPDAALSEDIDVWNTYAADRYVNFVPVPVLADVGDFSGSGCR